MEPPTAFVAGGVVVGRRSVICAGEWTTGSRAGSGGANIARAARMRRCQRSMVRMEGSKKEDRGDSPGASEDDLPAEKLFDVDQMATLRKRMENVQQSDIVDEQNAAGASVGELYSGDTSIEAVMESVPGFPDGVEDVWALKFRGNSTQRSYEYFTMRGDGSSQLLLAFQEHKDAAYFLHMMESGGDSSLSECKDCDITRVCGDDLYQYCENNGIMLGLIPNGGLDDCARETIEVSSGDTKTASLEQAKLLERLFQQNAENDPNTEIPEDEQ